MTERKGLKKIVRERMDRTGETYTSAHRMVVAKRRPGAPERVVPGYPAFGVERHGPSALVRHLLGQAGITLSEPMVCGLGGGVGFLYAVFEYRAVAHPLLTIVAQHHPQPWANTVLDHVAVAYSEQHSTAGTAAVAKLRAQVETGRPVLCTVDRSRLPWHEAGPMDVSADPYVVVVAGIDGETLYIDDHSDRPHEVAMDDFVAAWSAHKKGRHHMLSLNPGEVVSPDLGRAVRSAVAMTVAHLTGPVLGNAFDANMGLRGMAKLVSDLRDLRTRSGWARRFGTPVALGHALRRLDECLQYEYTAPDATRPIYADFLDEVAPLLPTMDAAGAAALFRDSGRQWAAITALARQAAADGDTVSLLGALADHVEAAHDAEASAVRLLT
jgi:hypothetical protein